MTSACRVAFVARIDDLMWEISLDLVVSEKPAPESGRDSAWPTLALRMGGILSRF